MRAHAHQCGPHNLDWVPPTMSESGLDSTVASQFSHLRAWSIIMDEVCYIACLTLRRIATCSLKHPDEISGHEL